MKPAKPHPSGLLPHLPPVLAMLSLGIASFGMFGQASAEAVDSELVLLVDVTQSGLNKNDFGSLMQSYASTFTSTEVLNSIQSGTYGRIAVSLMFYGNSSVQQVGIPWMSIGNATDASKFAALATSVSRPFSNGSSDMGSAQGVLATRTSVKVMKRSPRDVALANFLDETLKFTFLRGATFGSFTTPPS